MVMWRSVESEVHRHASGEGTKALEASSPKLLCGIVYHLLLHLINIFFSEGDDVDLIFDTSRIGILGGRFDFDCVDVVVPIIVMDVAAMLHKSSKKRVDAKNPQMGFLRSTYARVGEICFAQYRTQVSTRVVCAGIPVNLTCN